MSSGQAESPDAAAARLSFEQALAELEQIVAQLEAGELPLEESLVHYERGVARLRQCYALLEQAEARVSTLASDGRGGLVEGDYSHPSEGQAG